MRGFRHREARQALETAVLVAEANRIDLADIRRWSRQEGMEAKFKKFTARLSKKR